MDMRLKGRVRVAGWAEGEALVCREPITFWSVDRTTGVLYHPGHELNGRTLKDKILVYPCGSGAVGYFLWLLKQAGTSPKALVNMRPYSQELIDAVFAGIPMVGGFDQNLLSTVGTGDHLVVDGTEGTVEVTKRRA
jgi:predicted aconitase with swiveling domain